MDLENCESCVHCLVCQLEGFWCELECESFDMDCGFCEDYEKDIADIFVIDLENFEQEISTLDNIYG